MEKAPEYNKYGRLKYNPEFHANTGKPWTTEDLNYLIEFYDIAGSKEMSFALERTEQSIRQKANTLRKENVMAPATQKKNKKRAALTARMKNIQIHYNTD